MACCCTKTKELCSVTVCAGEEEGGGLIKTGFVAPSAGTFTLVLDFMGIEFRIAAPFQQDDPLDFPSTGLNEDYKYTAKIINSAGATLLFTEENFDCVSFQTKLSYEV